MKRSNSRRWDGDVQAPWSSKGWSTDEYRAHRDPDLDEKVQKSGGGVDPYGYYEDRPGLALSPVMHNPYFSLVFVPVFGWLGLFVFDKLRGQTGWSWILLVLFTSVALISLLGALLRIPAWHRARRQARAHVSDHGGQFPPELLWYR